MALEGDGNSCVFSAFPLSHIFTCKLFALKYAQTFLSIFFLAKRKSENRKSDEKNQNSREVFFIILTYLAGSCAVGVATAHLNN